MKHLGFYIILLGALLVLLSIISKVEHNVFLGLGGLAIVGGIVSYIIFYRKSEV
jgi:hypothetical protein